ncbi:MAG: 2Fe-2S iron-sulfur cluster binding domain-containing protein [Deltaproteobacteria bacterium]|nr:MAG: 2Fe-2S iron-sulfur cluster binding domain-containing protein [Deltaproteobacteria bacterium]
MPTLKIDGQEITVDRGTTILQAAAQLGVQIPTFCYHPGLSIAANCRMCLVDTNKAPKPLPACHAQVMDGMEVWTNNEKVQRTRKAVLEFILLNHPVDCPICDQAGECVLQDHYFKYSAQPSRLFHRKRHKAKAKILGPNVILDAERCILCTRCVRFCDEVAKSSQLTVVNRGEKSEITTFPGKQLDNPYAANTVDICPVGALTSRDFRFRTRVWMLSTERGVCPECSRGCSIRVDTFENTVRRYKPVHNPKVNDWWMCDAGRASFRGYLEDRVEGPTIVADGKRRAVATAKAVEDAAKAIQAAGGHGKVALVASPWLTNEDAYVLGRLVTGALAGVKVYMGGRAAGAGDDILIQPDKNPNRKGVDAIFAALGVKAADLSSFDAKGIETVFVFGDNHDASPATLEALAAVPWRIVAGTKMGPWWQLATTFLPLRLHWEKDGTYTNFDGVVQRIRRAVKAAPTCKSEGWYAMKLAQSFGDALAFDAPADIFAAVAGSVPEFAGLAWSDLGDHGLRFGEGSVPAGADAASAEPQMEATT